MGRSRGSKNKQTYERQSFETKKPGKQTGEPFAAIYSSMLGSDAWGQLSNNARVLYLYMKMQLFGGKRDGLPEGQFYFNRGTYMKTYNLYKNPNQFVKDRDLLIYWGFIDCIEHGKTTRTKNIYQFSDRWQKVEPEEVQKQIEADQKRKEEKKKQTELI